MLRRSAHPRHDPGSISAPGRLSHESVRAGQAYCRDVTRREARNFYWGFVALPRQQRMAIYALYVFARQVDDDADLPGVPSGPDRFDFHRDRVRRCFDGQVTDPVMHALAHAIDRYGIPENDLEALICGVERDLQTTRYATWEELQTYCLLVASSVGRMCVRVFGFHDEIAFRFADDLGVAMQLTNILRDLREDAEMGRIYLPHEDLQRFGVEEEALLGSSKAGRSDRHPGAGWESLMAYEIDRARSYFESGLQVTEQIPRRAAVCVLTMAGIYTAILKRLSVEPCLPLRERASVGTEGKLAIMLQSWLQAV